VCWTRPTNNGKKIEYAWARPKQKNEKKKNKRGHNEKKLK